ASCIVRLMALPLGAWWLFGLVLCPLRAVLTPFIMKMMLRTKYWKPESDEEVQLDSEFADAAAGGSGDADAKRSKADDLPLVVLFLPILVPLLLIGFGAFAGLFGFMNSVIGFFGDAKIALFIGLLLAYALGRVTVGSEST